MQQSNASSKLDTIARQCQIWVRSEVMTFGVFATPPHPRLGINNLRKLVIYCKQKARSTFPSISYLMWKHVACTKLQLTEEFSWILFENAIQFTTNTPELLTEIDRTRSMYLVGSITQAEFMAFLDNLSVNVISFASLLYLQQVHRISLRGSLPSLTRDEWPKLSSSRSLSASNLANDDSSHNNSGTSWSGSPGGGKYEENAHFQFVQANLAELFELCCVEVLLSNVSSTNSSANDAEKQAEKKSLTNAAVSLAHLEALSYLFAAYDDTAACANAPPSARRRVRSLGDVLTSERNAHLTGFDRSRRTFSYTSLIDFVRRNLIASPFGVSSCVTGRRLSWSVSVSPSTSADSNVSALSTVTPRGKVATNALNVYPEAVDGHKLILMTQVTHQVLARSSATLEHATIKIHRSHFSFIYLLSPVRAVSIEKCRGTTIVIGAAECSVSISHCDACTVICATRRVSIGSSRRCTIHALTPTQPLVFIGCEQLVFAPFHTFYARLESHLRAARICVTPTLWNHPFQCGATSMNASSSSSSSQAQAQSQASERCWDVLAPRDFYPFTIPFEFDEVTDRSFDDRSNAASPRADGENVTRSVPGGLPAEYQKAVVRRERLMMRWRTDVQAAQLSEAQQDRLKQLVQEKFQSWLMETGQQRHLEYLSKMA